MGVNEIIDEYCQITGRPKFTITIDEFLKLKQVVGDTLNQKSPTQAINEQIVFAAKSQDLPGKKANASEQGEKTSPLEQNEKAIKVTPIFLKEEGLKKQELSPMTNPIKQNQTSSALELLKSIKG